MAWDRVTVRADDEGRHRRGPVRLWGESWSYDLAAADASVGGFVRLGLYPNLGVAWYWAALVGRGRRLVLVRDHELDLPAGRELEVRGQGIWSAVNCETPLDHWSLGLEAFAVALDDPAEAYRGERGDLVGLGFDLEWEALAVPCGPTASSYVQPCRVSGEILIAEERLEFDGTGHRGHAWGVQDWWAGPGCGASAVFAGGASWAVGTGGGAEPWGYLAPALAPAPKPAPDPAAQPFEEVEPATVGVTATVDPDGLPVTASVSLGTRTFTATIMGVAPLLLEGPDGPSTRLARALCVYRADEGRPDHGVGWADWLG